MDTLTLDRHIESTPGVCGSKPRIAGRRITVQNIVVWHEHLRMSADEIAREYDLSLAQIHAALAFYFDHVEEINEQIRNDDAYIEEMRKQYPSLLERRLKN